MTLKERIEARATEMGLKFTEIVFLRVVHESFGDTYVLMQEAYNLRTPAYMAWDSVNGIRIAQTGFPRPMEWDFQDL